MYCAILLPCQKYGLVSKIPRHGFGQKREAARAVQQQQFEHAYLFGAVCVNIGESEAIVAPMSNMEVMKKHLELISEATPIWLACVCHYGAC